MFVIKRTDKPGYVARPGSKNSYTPDLRRARKFTTREEAVQHCRPENEVVKNLYDEIGKE